MINMENIQEQMKEIEAEIKNNLQVKKIINKPFITEIRYMPGTGIVNFVKDGLKDLCETKVLKTPVLDEIKLDTELKDIIKDANPEKEYLLAFDNYNNTLLDIKNDIGKLIKLRYFKDNMLPNNINIVLLVNEADKTSLYKEV